MNRSRSTLAVAIVASLGLASCGDGQTSFEVNNDVSKGGTYASTTQLPLLQAMAEAPFTVSYCGERRVEQHLDVDGVPSVTIQREGVCADGSGAFSVRLLDSIQPILGPTELQMLQALQSARAGFLYLERDFRIRDLPLFLQNYAVVTFPGAVDVAGRSCVELEVQRQEGADRRYLLAVDPANGLVLRSREEDLNGQLISLVEFELLQLDPDFTDVEFHPTTPDQPLDLEDPDLAGIHFEFGTPRFLPEGFQLRTTEVVDDASDSSRWVKLAYGDGVEQLFFLHGGPLQRGGMAGNTNARFQDFDQDVVRVLRVGPWSVAQGEVGGQRVITVGKRAEHELLLMLESALP